MVISCWFRSLIMVIVSFIKDFSIAVFIAMGIHWLMGLQIASSYCISTCFLSIQLLKYVTSHTLAKTLVRFYRYILCIWLKKWIRLRILVLLLLVAALSILHQLLDFYFFEFFFFNLKFRISFLQLLLQSLQLLLTVLFVFF